MRSESSSFTVYKTKEIVYQKISHASHYAKLGRVWYSNFVNAELAEIAIHPLQSDALNPYGSASTTNSPIIALGEAWAYHMGHFLADQRYGTLSSCHGEQVGGFSYCPNPPTNSAHPNIDVLEAFDPNLTADPFKWIPKGLMQDLMDNTPTETFPIPDNVTGFTISQLFLALQSDVTTVPQYRSRLILQNPTISATGITNLFSQYHY